MDYLLRNSLTESDIEFLNETTMDFEIVNTDWHAPMEGYDSGWCDGVTGHRLITHQNRVVFRNVTAAQYTYLELRYRERLNELTDGLKGIYNITQTLTKDYFLL